MLFFRFSKKWTTFLKGGRRTLELLRKAQRQGEGGTLDPTLDFGAHG